MRLTLSKIGILLYAIPAISSLFIVPLFGYTFSEKGSSAILISVLATIVGYAFTLPIKSTRKDQQKLPYKSILKISYFLMALGILIEIINLIKIGTIPLLSKNQNSTRVELQNSILWNFYIAFSIGIYLFSFSESQKKASKTGWFLLGCYLVLALSSAWKGVLLNFLFLFALPKLKNLKISTRSLFLATIGFLLIFILINGLRSEDFLTAISQPIFYTYWGFVNFDSIATAAQSSCIHSIPIIGCKFEVSTNEFINPTWNVYTALTPLYIDGGNILIFLTFFFMSFSLGCFEKAQRRIVLDFFYYASFYFFFVSNNAYIFYSSFYITSIILLSVLSLISKNFRARSKSHA